MRTHPSPPPVLIVEHRRWARSLRRAITAELMIGEGSMNSTIPFFRLREEKKPKPCGEPVRELCNRVMCYYHIITQVFPQVPSIKTHWPLCEVLSSRTDFWDKKLREKERERETEGGGRERVGEYIDGWGMFRIKCTKNILYI